MIGCCLKGAGKGRFSCCWVYYGLVTTRLTQAVRFCNFSRKERKRKHVHLPSTPLVPDVAATSWLGLSTAAQKEVAQPPKNALMQHKKAHGKPKSSAFLCWFSKILSVKIGAKVAVEDGPKAAINVLIQFSFYNTKKIARLDSETHWKHWDSWHTMGFLLDENCC